LLDPQPRVVFRLLHQSTAHRILPKVFQFLLETFLGSEHVVKGLFLPDRAASAQELINASGRGSLEQLQNKGQRERLALFVAQRRKQEMYMIRHHHRPMKLKPLSVIVQTVLQHGISGIRRKRVPIAPAESYE
jgi:hypothetical protein